MSVCYLGGRIIRILAVTLIISATGICGCSSNSPVISEKQTTPATIEGVFVEHNGNREVVNSVQIANIDGVSRPINGSKGNTERLWSTDPGPVEISMQVTEKNGGDLTGRQILLPSLFLKVEPDTSYRVEASYVSDRLLAYWIEEIDSELAVSKPRIYALPEIPEQIAPGSQIEEERNQKLVVISKDPKIHAFPSVVRGSDSCVVLIREIKALKDLGPLKTTGTLLAFSLMMFVTGPQSLETKSEYVYRLESIEGICFKAEVTHQYEIRSEPDPSSVKTRPYRKPRFSNLYQVWDQTNDELVKEFKLKDLESKIIVEYESGF